MEEKKGESNMKIGNKSFEIMEHLKYWEQPQQMSNAIREQINPSTPNDL
jgi:hypothetical protein